MQRSTLAAIAAAALVGGVAIQEASANSASVTQEPISPEARTDDPNLNNKVFNALHISVPAGFDWTNAEISIRRNPGNTGTVYNAPVGNAADTVASPAPSLWAVPTFRMGPFDTLVQGRNNSAATLVPGRAPQDGPGKYIGLGGDSDPPGSDAEDPSVMVSIAWGNSSITPPDDGNFMIGRFTLSNDFDGTFIGNTFASDVPLGAPTPFAGIIVDGRMIIPEPSSLGLVAAGGLLALRRRSRRV